MARERQRMDPAHRGVDEDKGSPSQDGANPLMIESL